MLRLALVEFTKNEIFTQTYELIFRNIHQKADNKRCITHRIGYMTTLPELHCAIYPVKFRLIFRVSNQEAAFY